MGLSFPWSSAAFPVQRTAVAATGTAAESATGGAEAAATGTDVAAAVAAPEIAGGRHHSETAAGEETGIGLGTILTAPGPTGTDPTAVVPQRGWASTRRGEWEGLGPVDHPLNP